MLEVANNQEVCSDVYIPVINSIISNNVRLASNFVEQDCLNCLNYENNFILYK